MPVWVSICPADAAAYDDRCVDGYACMGGYGLSQETRNMKQETRNGRSYTRAEIKMLKQRIRDIRQGKCFCLYLMKAWSEKKISEDQYNAAKRLEIPCPLHTSGECTICRDKIAEGKIDVFQAAQDLG